MYFLSDIENDEIDIVVVYKVDRLTRSLMDFAKIIDIFDKHETSFVSITQQFNTTTSMGRLTLNILLSFAQFEREVTGERIRDKFAASRKKGMFMHGIATIGYIKKDGILYEDKEHSYKIKTIFKKYIEFKSVAKLQNYIKDKPIKKQNNILNFLESYTPDVVFIRTVLNKTTIYQDKIRILIDKDLLVQAIEAVMYGELLSFKSTGDYFLDVSYDVKISSANQKGTKIVIGHNKIEYNLTLI